MGADFQLDAVGRAASLGRPPEEALARAAGGVRADVVLATTGPDGRLVDPLPDDAVGGRVHGAAVVGAAAVCLHLPASGVPEPGDVDGGPCPFPDPDNAES
ncbi:MAG: hypothetical protein U5R31_11360 [Acidimicrobiia bacterium]|nr:hypothetical protein [Acidimicrobiia bacterium]